MSISLIRRRALRYERIPLPSSQKLLQQWCREVVVLCQSCMQVAAWQAKVREQAKKDIGLHRVQTMLGRHRMLPGYGKGKTSREEARASRAAINTPIQGSAADVVAAAMVRIHLDPIFRQIGWRMLLQVHDEVRGAGLIHGQSRTRTPCAS